MRTLRRLLIGPALAAVFVGVAAAQDKQKETNDARAQEAARRAQDAAQARQRAVLEAQLAAQMQAAQLNANAALVGRVQQAWPDEQFERYVFQQDQTADRARRKFESLLTSRVDELERTCELTLTQMRKLQMMGQGDIKRFFDNYETVKARFKSMNNDVNRIQEIQPDLGPLRVTLQTGPFTDDSLLTKSLRTMLTDDQLAKYDGIAEGRRSFRHRANVELAVSMLEQAMPLRDEQRRELIALVEKETTPPKKGGQYEAYLIIQQMSQLPEAKFKAILSDTQKRVLDQQITQFAATVVNLRQNGLIADVDFAFPVPARPVPAGVPARGFRIAPPAPPAPVPVRPVDLPK
jgi:hypothetical protein